MPYLKTLLALLLTLFRHSQMQCDLVNLNTRSLEQEALRKVVVHQDHRRCSSLDLSYQRVACEIWDEADKTSLVFGTCSTNECSRSSCAYTQETLIPCSDGSFNMTCLPLDNSKAYTCICHSVTQPDPSPCTDTYQWDNEWRDIRNGRQGLFRQLCNQTTEQCVATEYLFGVAHLVKYIPLPDANISASSEWNSYYLAKTARIDNYLQRFCTWIAHRDDPAPYLQFDFPQTYLVLGVLIRARCDPPYNNQRVTKVNIQYSLDNATWYHTTPPDIIPHYGRTVNYTEYVESSTHFFDKASSGRYWRIYVLNFVGARALKADFLAKI